jgi:hypothetical protein
VKGNLLGYRLKLLSFIHTNWASWKAKHPKSQVLSDDTGYRRDYDRDTYQGYETSERLMFGMSAKNRKYHPKENVIGVKLGGVTKTHPLSELNIVVSPIKDVLEKITVQNFL